MIEEIFNEDADYLDPFNYTDDFGEYLEDCSDNTGSPEIYEDYFDDEPDFIEEYYRSPYYHRQRRLAYRRRRALDRLHNYQKRRAIAKRRGLLRARYHSSQRHPRKLFPYPYKPSQYYSSGSIEPVDLPLAVMDYGIEPRDVPAPFEELEGIDIWPDEYDVLEVTEDPFETIEDYMFEIDDLNGPSILNDSTGLAETLREVLHENYLDSSNEEMQEALFDILDTMTPAEGFNFIKTLHNIRKAGKKILKNPVVGQIAKVALPAAGATVGTMIGGPIGTAVGGKLGHVASQAFSSGQKTRSTPAHAMATKKSPKGGSAAAAQLLQLTQNPDMLKSLMALALGSQGRKSIKVGQNGPKVDTGGFINLLSTLVKKASEDADELARDSEEASAYLIDSEGDYLVDPSDPIGRAEALYNVLIDTENE